MSGLWPALVAARLAHPSALRAVRRLRSRTGAALVGFVALASSACAEPTTIKVDLLRHGVGIPPYDFDFWQTGGGPPGRWAVVRDPTAFAGVAIEQFSTDKAQGRLPLAIYHPISLKNVLVTVRFELLEGSTQAAGIAVRVTSADSYYVAVASAREKRVDLFRFIGDQRRWIAGATANVACQKWQTLSVIGVENRFTVALNDVPVIVASDNGFAGDGHVALWTEEDNVTRFEEIVIAPAVYQDGTLVPEHKEFEVKK